MSWSGLDAYSREGPGLRRYAARDLAGLLSPMRMTLAPSRFGYVLNLEPAGAREMLPAWRDLALTCDAQTLVRHESADLAAAAARDGVQPGASFRPSALVLADAGLARAHTLLTLPELSLVLIEGEIEAVDARAIAAGEAEGLSPLDAELRALAALRTRGDRSAELHVREFDHAARFVAEAFRRYLSTLLNADLQALALPEPGLIHRLLDESGELSVRPIETEIYSTAVDVGISTEAGGLTRPANQSLIYDLYANTWHGD